MFGCMFGMIAFGFFLGFKVIYRVIYGFWDWIYECEGVTRCFRGFGVSPGVSLGV